MFSGSQPISLPTERKVTPKAVLAYDFRGRLIYLYLCKAGIVVLTANPSDASAFKRISCRSLGVAGRVIESCVSPTLAARNIRTFAKNHISTRQRPVVDLWIQVNKVALI